MGNEPRGRKVEDDAVDAGMREAFRKGGTGRSVLARLESRGGPVPRVVLVGAGTDSGPIVRQVTREENAGGSRYQIAGEIARGGVGVVLKGRDVDLGRDVAVKILLEKHESNEEVVQRFVEEAQIGGQLQHPGIVPVHELGMTADGRPFIAMKLVKGRTLSALLLERESPSEDRPRFLGIFEKVCQTLAYAHSRNVVHRDLKPSNVMVGSFGEVQVLDWGLAKVLARGGLDDERRASRSQIEASVIETVRSGQSDSESVAGTVMGTPAYMAPEQAEGRVEDIDVRTDVFALGALLSELLTGHPPYRGKEAHPVFEAQAGFQADVLSRLDTCGADPELVSLAKRCLLRKQESRPRDAAEVAGIVASHLADVEERAKQAELAAAEAVVKVKGERKARKLTMALSAAILVAILIGAGAWIWREADQRQQAEEAAETVNAALVEAARLRGEAQRAPVEDPSEWKHVRAEAERVMSLVEASAAPPEVRERAEAFLAAVRGEEARALEAATSAKRDRATIEGLSTLALLRGDDFEPNDVSAEYRSAFAAFGLDLGGMDLRSAADRIEASARASELTDALDRWFAVRCETGEKSGASQLLTVLSLADPDPVRSRIRSLRLAGDAKGLMTLANETQDLPLATLLLLGDALGQTGEVERAVSLLSAARDRAQAHPRAVFLLGLWKTRAEPADHAGAAPLFSLLAALCPGEAGALYHHGQALQGQGDLPGALGKWIGALTSDPERYGFLRDRITDAAVATAQKLRFSPVGGVLVGELERAAELVPDRLDVQLELGLALARAGSWEAARGALARALWMSERDALAPMIYAVALCRTGDDAGAIRVLREAARRNPALWARQFALPGAGRIVHRPPGIVEPPSTTEKERWSLAMLGGALLKMGAPDAALTVYEELLHNDPGFAPAAFGQGLSLFYLDKKEEAERAFRRAADLDPADAAPLYWLASLHVAAGNLEEGWRRWDEAGGIDPEHLRLRAVLSVGPIPGDKGVAPSDVQFLANYLAMVGAEPARIVGVLEEAVLRAPDNYTMARNLAMNLQICGRDGDAAKAYTRAIENAERMQMSQAQAWVTALYAVLLAESADPEVRDPDESLKLARKGVEEEESSYGKVAVGIALYRQGKIEKALTALEGAQSIKFDCRLYLAMARMQIGDRQGGEREFDNVLKSISAFYKDRPLHPRLVALRAEACGLFGRPVPD